MLPVIGPSISAEGRTFVTGARGWYFEGMDVLSTANVRQKLREIESACHLAVQGKLTCVPLQPARDLELVPFSKLPPKKGLSFAEGRARMLHDLASIELQAMELGLRGLIEYPDAPLEFREDLVELTIDEGRHLELCLNGIEELGFKWGDWPTHVGLWNTVGADDEILDRVIIVHRYLEASGLDAGTKMLQRLNGLQFRDVTHAAVDRIHREEIGHVGFGSRWYRELCRRVNLDPDADFEPRMRRLRERLPYRTEQYARAPRLAAGFTEHELDVMERWRGMRPDARA